MKPLLLVCSALAICAPAAPVHPAIPAEASVNERYGPAAALQFARRYQGDAYVPDVLQCYPEAKGIPFSDTENIIPVNGEGWRPEQLAEDFRLRMIALPADQRKKGIILLLKTERCATKPPRLCSITTAALEKRSTPLAAEFLIYGVWLKPRDNDDPPGTLKIETGDDAWKNEAAGVYKFEQGPGATLVFIDPVSGKIIEQTNATKLSLFMHAWTAGHGETPLLHAKLEEILNILGAASR